MYRRLVIIVVSVISTLSVFACDVCGSGAGGGYIGLLPGFKNRFISLRYSQNGLRSHLGPGGSSTYLSSREHFRMLELWGAANLGKRFRIAGFIPMNFLERKNGMGQFRKNGPGDITLLGYYQVINTQKNNKSGQGIAQSLWMGAGIKLPVGRYYPDETNIQESSQNSFQLGTGSLDFSANMLYDARMGNTGINANLSYKVNSTNKFGYQYGDKVTANVLAYHSFNAGKKISIAPNTGLLLEAASKDEKSKTIQVWETGGCSLMGTLGLEFSLKQWGFGMNFQTPLSQNLGEGKLKAMNRGMAYVSISF